MKQDGTVSLFRYWDRLRQGRAAPRRTEIEPADIKGLLADTFILERDMRGEAVFRLAGTRLCALYGRELKGFSLASLWSAQDRRLVSKLADGALAQRSVMVVQYDATSSGNRKVECEMLLLPLDGGRDNPRALGCIHATGRLPWLGSDPLVEGRIQSVRAVDPEREHLFLTNRPAIELAPALSPDADVLSSPLPPGQNRRIEPHLGGRRIRHLVVYKGGLDGA